MLSLFSPFQDDNRFFFLFCYRLVPFRKRIANQTLEIGGLLLKFRQSNFGRNRCKYSCRNPCLNQMPQITEPPALVYENLFPTPLSVIKKKKICIFRINFLFVIHQVRQVDANVKNALWSNKTKDHFSKRFPE